MFCIATRESIFRTATSCTGGQTAHLRQLVTEGGQRSCKARYKAMKTVCGHAWDFLSCRDPDSDFGPALIRSQCLHARPPPVALFVLEVILTTLGNLAVQCFSLKILHKLQSVCWEKIVRRWRSIRRSDGEKEFPHKEWSGLRLTDSF